MSTVIVGACLIALGVLLVAARRAVSEWNARASKRIAVNDRDPANHRPDRDEKWAAAGGVILIIAGLVLLVLGLTSV